jgi:hypothetical protein
MITQIPQEITLQNSEMEKLFSTLKEQEAMIHEGCGEMIQK